MQQIHYSKVTHMKKYILFSILLLIASQSFGQALDITVDSRGNYQYLSDKDNYRANMDKSFSGSLTFYDNRGNKVSRSDRYIKLKHPGLYGNKDAEHNYFIEMIKDFRFENNYVASYSADIFDKISFSENKQREYANRPPAQNSDLISRNRNGSLEFRNRRANAIFEKDFFNNCIYKDSNNNEIKLSSKTWEVMIREYGDDICVFSFLIDSFLLGSNHNH